MKKIKGLFGITVCFLAVMIVFAGCGGGGVTVEKLAGQLASLKVNTADAPYTVRLAKSVTIVNDDTSPTGAWATVNSTVLSAGKYVVLDLSSCSAAENSIFSGGGPNSMSIIKENKYVKGVILPKELITIGDGAFKGCGNLTSVTIGNRVTTIGDEAFFYCPLTSVIIPDSVTTIGEQAFAGCPLTSVTIGNRVTTIGYRTFALCEDLASVTIPNSVTTIGEQAFYECTSLASVTIPDSVTTIGEEAFYKCTSLASVTIPDSVTTIGERAFYGCTSLASVTIPDSVTAIGNWAFSPSTSVTKQKGVEFIGGKGPAGGIVFYDKGDASEGWRYLEAAPAETEWQDVLWGTNSTRTGFETKVGSGKENTRLIVTELAKTGETGYAAQLCNSLSFGGCNDWFLPSMDELNLMYQNIKRYGEGGFSDGWYWSSSTTSWINDHIAWIQRFSNGEHSSALKQNNHYRDRYAISARAIRDF